LEFAIPQSPLLLSSIRQWMPRLGEFDSDCGCVARSFPWVAIAWDAYIEFFVFRSLVAKTISSDLIRITAIAKQWQILTLLSALVGPRYGTSSLSDTGCLPVHRMS
jgi:hypothetical protein